MSRFPWVAWAVPVAVVAFLSLREIGTSDFWWQWAAGKHILAHGIPTLDPWLTTPEPRPWIEMRWLYCVGLYASVENVGAWLAIVCVAVLYAIGLAFALNAGAKGSPWTMATGMLAMVAVSRRLSVRPEAFTFAFLGLLLFMIARVRQGKLKPGWALLWLGLIQIAWCNTHALFAIGPIFCFLWVALEILTKGDNLRPALAAVIVTAACSFVNPYGLQGVLYPLVLLGELHGGAYRGNIIELQTPFALGFSPSLVAHLLLAVWVFVCALRKRGDGLLLLFSAATFYLSITIVRNVPLFALCASAYITTCNFQPSAWSKWSQRLAVAVGVITAAVFAAGTWSIEDRTGLSVNKSRYGLQAARALVAAHPKGPIFNTLVEGSLLEAEGVRAYCDPRLEVLPQSRFLEMMSIARLQRPLPDTFQSVLLTLDSPLAAHLVKEGGWRLVGMDRVAISLVRQPGAKIARDELRRLALDALPHNPPPFSPFRKALSPIPYRRVATFFANLGDKEFADRIRAESLRIYPVP